MDLRANASLTPAERRKRKELKTAARQRKRERREATRAHNVLVQARAAQRGPAVGAEADAETPTDSANVGNHTDREEYVHDARRECARIVEQLLALRPAHIASAREEVGPSKLMLHPNPKPKPIRNPTPNPNPRSPRKRTTCWRACRKGPNNASSWTTRGPCGDTPVTSFTSARSSCTRACRSSMRAEARSTPRPGGRSSTQVGHGYTHGRTHVHAHKHAHGRTHAQTTRRASSLDRWWAWVLPGWNGAPASPLLSRQQGCWC